MYAALYAKNKAKLKCKQWQLLAIKYLFLANLRAPEELTNIFFFFFYLAEISLTLTVDDLPRMRNNS